MNSNYCCPFDHQEFSSREELAVHIQERHILYQEEQKSENCSLEDSFESAPFQSTQSDLALSAVLKNLNIPENPLCDLGKLSEKAFLKLTNCTHLGGITQLDLEEKGISQFESNESLQIFRLSNLRYLNLSKNYLSCVKGVGECLNLQKLNIANNNIEDLGPIQNLVLLTHLNASSNKVKDIAAVRACEHLKCLKVNSNQIFNFQHSLAILKSLKRFRHLCIERNPCFLKTKNAFQEVLSVLALEKLNGHKVSEQDRKRASDSYSVNLELPAKATSEYKDFRQKRDKTEVETKIKLLREENSKLRSDLSKIWNVLSAIIAEKQKQGIEINIDPNQF